MGGGDRRRGELLPLTAEKTYTTAAWAAWGCRQAATLLPGVGAFLHSDLPLPACGGIAVLERRRRVVTVEIFPELRSPLSGLVLRIRAARGEGKIVAGRGIGRVGTTAWGTPLQEAAISPSARRLIAAAVAPRLVSLTIESPNGEEIARRTLNPIYGILGGIGILGGEGILGPHDEARKETQRRLRAVRAPEGRAFGVE